MPIILPPPPVRALAPAEAGAIAGRARKLLRRGLLTHHQHALLDCLLWACRNPVTGAIVVSYTALQKLAHMARGTISGALRALESLGLLTTIRRRVRLSWANGGHASRQATNAYVLHPPANTEFSERTVEQKLEIIQISPADVADVRAAQAALAGVRERRRAAIAGRLLGRGNRMVKEQH
jgi:hypothetical protein